MEWVQGFLIVSKIKVAQTHSAGFLSKFNNKKNQGSLSSFVSAGHIVAMVTCSPMSGHMYIIIVVALVKWWWYSSFKV